MAVLPFKDTPVKSDMVAFAQEAFFNKRRESSRDDVREGNNAVVQRKNTNIFIVSAPLRTEKDTW